MIRFDDILDKISDFSEKETTLLRKAYVFAAQAHKGQVRRSGEPYLSHPLEVANMLAEMKMDVTTIAAGLLHDVLEDTEVTLPDLRKAFGKDLSDLVGGVTKISRLQESTPETRQAETIRKIILAMIDDLRVIFIKLADRIHNLKTLKFLSEDKQKRVAKETLDIYAPIANRLGMGRTKAELEDLSFRYVDPDGYFKIASLVDPQRKETEKELKKLKKSLYSLMKQNNIPADISFRIKRLYSIHNKMVSRALAFNEVYDFMALRLLTNTVENCYKALGIIHQNWPHLPHRFRDFIAMSKPNLYKSLHTTIITEKKRTVELQIRTQEMHELAENGIAAHWKYKEAGTQTILREDQRLRWLREMADFYKEQKSPKQFLQSLKTNLLPEEISVFTPKGERIPLPLGASALDFAFKIHSEVGLHASGARINSRNAALKTILKNGDIVEILTAPEVTAQRSWLNIVFSSTAQHHIKRWLNQQAKIKNKLLGRKIWEKETAGLKVDPDIIKSESFIQKISKETHFRLKKPDDFYLLLGTGKLMLDGKLKGKLFGEKLPSLRRAPLLKKVVTRITGRPKTEIRVKEGGAGLVNIARCCQPIKGEPIVGYMTSGKGISVHAIRCPYVSKNILDRQRLVDVSWDADAQGPYKGRLLIKSEDAPGVLAKLTSVIAQLEGNITKAEVNTSADNKAQVKLTLEVQDIQHLSTIMKKILAIREIISLERI